MCSLYSLINAKRYKLYLEFITCPVPRSQVNRLGSVHIGPTGQYRLVGWLFWVKRPFETVFQSISGRLPERGRKRRERIEESKNVQTTPTRTYCKRNRPLPYYHPNCRTPRHWKFTQGHRTTRPLPDQYRAAGPILLAMQH